MIERDPSFLMDRMDRHIKNSPTQLTSLHHHLTTMPISDVAERLDSLGALYFTDTHLISDRHFFDFYSYEQISEME